MTPYQEYLQSEHWRKLRQAKLDNDGHACSLCRCDKRIQVHHIIYRHPWTLCTTEDLQVMCEWCHDRFHRKGLPSQRKPEQFRSKSGSAIKAMFSKREAKKLSLINARTQMLKRLNSLTGFARRKYARKMCRRLGLA